MAQRNGKKMGGNGDIEEGGGGGQGGTPKLLSYTARNTDKSESSTNREEKSKPREKHVSIF